MANLGQLATISWNGDARICYRGTCFNIKCLNKECRHGYISCLFTVILHAYQLSTHIATCNTKRRNICFSIMALIGGNDAAEIRVVLLCNIRNDLQTALSSSITAYYFHSENFFTDIKMLDYFKFDLLYYC